MIYTGGERGRVIFTSPVPVTPVPKVSLGFTKAATGRINVVVSGVRFHLVRSGSIVTLTNNNMVYMLNFRDVARLVKENLEEHCSVLVSSTR
jgi:hypothetical protein